MCFAPRGTDPRAAAVTGVCVTRQDENHDLPLSCRYLPTMPSCHHLLHKRHLRANTCLHTNTLKCWLLRFNDSRHLVLVGGSVWINSQSVAGRLQGSYWVSLQSLFLVLSVFLSCCLRPAPWNHRQPSRSIPQLSLPFDLYQILCPRKTRICSQMLGNNTVPAAWSDSDSGALRRNPRSSLHFALGRQPWEAAKGSGRDHQP